MGTCLRNVFPRIKLFSHFSKPSNDLCSKHRTEVVSFKRRLVTAQSTFFSFLFRRALRNEHRKKLLLLTSDKSLEGKLLSSLPELPLRTTRMFSTKDLKRQTQKKVNNLNEVQQKKKEETVKNLKRKNRLMTEIFNKVRHWPLGRKKSFALTIVFISTEFTTKRAQREPQSLQHRQPDLEIG